MIDQSVSQTAARALEILNEDGWCKGSVNFRAISDLHWITTIGLPAFQVAPGQYETGSHCLGGAWNLALHDDPSFLREYPELYEPLTEVILAQYPEIADIGFTDPSAVIANFNDRPLVTESDVRVLLEKLAAA